MTVETRLELRLLEKDIDDSLHRLCRERDNLHFYESFAEARFIHRIWLCLTRYWQFHLCIMGTVAFFSNLFTRFSWYGLVEVVIGALLISFSSTLFQFQFLTGRRLLFLIRSTKKIIDREKRIYQDLFNKFDELLSSLKTQRSE